MKNESNIILDDPVNVVFGNEARAEIIQPLDLDFEAQWQTPGLYLAYRIKNNPLVRFIGETLLNDYMQVIVVVDDDKEELVDEIFSIEQEMYHKFNKLKFDMRLRVIAANEDIDIIKKTTINRYDRSLFIPHE